MPKYSVVSNAPVYQLVIAGEVVAEHQDARTLRMWIPPCTSFQIRAANAVHEDAAYRQAVRDAHHTNWA